MSGELRAVLTEALEGKIADALCPIILANMRFPDQLHAYRQARRMAETVLSLPGVAVIQLPEPDRTDNDAAVVATGEEA
ncbi:hypothetical protein SEA_SAGEFIRE_76 [Mycobacterium phage Sagefire]|nr:hypothetical protein SEA_SAGEFIRE_76 [Mycobacterium phage Sagefire]